MLNNTSAPSEILCIDNIEDKLVASPLHNKVSPITANKAMDLLPLAPSAFASPSSTLIRTSSFYYDSESNDDDHELSFNCLYIGDQHRCSDYDSDCDSVPLIERITPPPPLLSFVLNNMKSRTDIDDDDDEIASVHNLSVMIPSPLTLSNSSAAEEEEEEEESCDLFEMNHVNTVITPMSYAVDVHEHDTDEEEEIQASGGSYTRIVCTPCCDKLRGTKDDKEKRFDWSAAGDHDVNVMNEYLMQHIQSLMDDNLSE